ncbi:hypothetical protein SAMN05421780_11429 [Flexibacter flexilis DSM 6793]|uniref:Uncharacterized protein n=1 Tax=Flexibacter flexilis DSM 6793 TaxID=927664 RepID=A0A1I1NCY8_9BACT|nr:hypothetical protein SAMN05421780_11429 [Flexibacter flexilis DSM 6793]
MYFFDLALYLLLNNLYLRNGYVFVSFSFTKITVLLIKNKFLH